VNHSENNAGKMEKQSFIGDSLAEENGSRWQKKAAMDLDHLPVHVWLVYTLLKQLAETTLDFYGTRFL
jgi:hypothetical protein